MLASPSTCPCDFSATALAVVGIDGSGDEQCDVSIAPSVTIQTDVTDPLGEDVGLAFANTFGCGLSFGGTFSFIFGDLGAIQSADCMFDLQQNAACQ